MSPKDAVGWGIDALAVFAAGVAVFFAWKANGIAQRALDLQLAPADLSVSVSDPIWLAERPGKGATPVPMLIATVTVTNAGAQQGCVNDLLFAVRLPLTNDERRFTPLYFMDPREVIAALAKPAPIETARRAPFGPVVVLGKQQVSEAIGFYAGGMDRSEFSAGSYSVSLNGAECAAPDNWRELWKATYIFTPEEIGRLIGGGPATHASEERRKAFRAAPVH